MSQDPIDEVNPGGVQPPKAPTGQQPQTTPDQSAFKSEMQKKSAPEPAKPAEGVSPMELAGSQGQEQTPTPNSINTQITEATNTYQHVQTELQNNQNLKFKKSQEYLMKNKLADANDNIQKAGAKLGATMPPPKQAPPGAGPVNKFIAMVEDGQTQLTTAQNHLTNLAAKGEQINPADLLLVQARLSRAQTEINFTSILLSKVVEAFKTISQTQI
jgi:hypothetical protein